MPVNRSPFTAEESLEYLREVSQRFNAPKAYVASPVFGIPLERRAESFEAGRKLALRYGYAPVLPPEIEVPEHAGACPLGRHAEGSPHAEACHLKADFKALLDCQAIILMPGWVHSWGCRMELQIASAAGLDVRFAIVYANDLKLVDCERV